ncbi:MAG: hypothetical protein IJ693_11500 [Bacteroidaceae bacterium]|nr:hypothetical protein [Bacteroidaceae bacterium]
MSIAIRYFSKFGHTEKMVGIITELTGVKAETVAVPLTEPVDTLYLGSGVLLGKVNGAVVDFIKTLKPEQVKMVICFGSCAIIKSPVPQMRQLLEAQGITVSTQEFTCKGSMGPLHAGHPNAKDMEDFKKFVQSTL